MSILRTQGKRHFEILSLSLFLVGETVHERLTKVLVRVDMGFVQTAGPSSHAAECLRHRAWYVEWPHGKHYLRPPSWKADKANPLLRDANGLAAPPCPVHPACLWERVCPTQHPGLSGTQWPLQGELSAGWPTPCSFLRWGQWHFWVSRKDISFSELNKWYLKIQKPIAS